MKKHQILYMYVILIQILSSCSNPPPANPLSRFYYSEDRCQIPNNEYQQALMNIFTNTSDVFSKYDQEEWPLGVMPVMFIVEPSGNVTDVKILKNSPTDTTFIHSIKNIYYELKFTPFGEQKPDTILFNSLISRKK